MLIDGYTFGVAYAVKAYRAAALWFFAYLIEKAYLDSYLTNVFVHDRAPTSIYSFVFAVLAAEILVFGGLMAVLLMFAVKFKGETNAFVIDGDVIRALWLDYAVSTVLIAVLGVALAGAVQNCALFHYRHEGMRGIRAYGELLVKTMLVVMALPYFLAARASAA